MIKDGDLVLEWLRDANSQQDASPAGSMASPVARLKSGQDSMDSDHNSTMTGNRVSNQGKFAR